MEMATDRGQRNRPPPHDHQHRRARSIGSSVLSSQLFQAGRVVAGSTDFNGHSNSIDNTTIATNASQRSSNQPNVDPLAGTVVGRNVTSNIDNRSQCPLPAQQQQQQRETMLSVLISAYQVRWRAVEERLATHPFEATILDCEGRSVLYRALSRRPGDYPPVRIVRKILQISPRSIWERHNGKTVTTLIEMACWRRASLETLEVLTAGRPSIPEDAPAVLALWKAYVELHGGDESSLIEFLRSTNIENPSSSNNDTIETDSSSSEDDENMEGPDHDDHGVGNDNNSSNNHNNVRNGGHSNENESFIVGCKFQLILKYLTAEHMRECSIETALSSQNCSLELFKIFVESLGPSNTSWDAVRPGIDRRHGTILFTKKLEYLKDRMQHHDQKIVECAVSSTTKRHKPDLVTANHLRGTKGTVGIGRQPVWISPELETILDRIGTASTSDIHRRNELYGQFVATIRTPVDPSWHQLIGAAKVLHSPLSLMRLLIDLHPEKLLHADEQGWLPLHHAIAGPSRDDILSIILESYPESCRHRDGHGRLPFHLACLAGKSARVLSELQKYLPKSIEENDPLLRLPPALLAAQSDRTSVCNVFHLLRSSPDVVCGKTLEAKNNV